MNTKLVRTVIYPLQERLLGRDTFSLLDRLEETQWNSANQMRAMQAEKLSRLLRHAERECPYYTNLFVTRGLDVKRGDPFEILAGMPLLDKATIRHNLSDLTARRVRGGIRVMTTGGSTGEPLRFHVDRTREAFDKAARMRSHRWFGVEPGDREVYLWGAPVKHRRQDRMRACRDWLFNDMLLSAFDLSPQRTRTYVRKMLAFQPVCIFGYPSSLARLCRFARDEGLTFHAPTLKAVFVTGEVLDEGQRREIESFFGVPVADGYGGRDSGFCAHECPHGQMHVTSEHIVMEIVDEDGCPLPTGRCGEIVITNLDNRALPFIRYRTGDVGMLTEAACPCRRASQIIATIRGRQTDHLVATDGSLRHALSLIYVLREMREIKQFQVHQQRDRSIDLMVVMEESPSGRTKTRLSQGVRDCLGDSLDTRLHIVDRIDEQPSGKFRHVISDALPV